MKIAIVADVHVGNHAYAGGVTAGGINERCALTLVSLRAALHQARERRAATFFIAGDLFHTRRPEPAIIAAVQRVLREEMGQMPVVIVPGNHDMLDATASAGNTACEPLHQQATVIRQPTWVETDAANVLCVPFSSEMPMAEYLAAVLAKEHTGRIKPPILVTHVGVYGKDAPSWMASARDAIEAGVLLDLMAAHGFTQAVVGNFHQHGEWRRDDHGPVVVQVGTLCPVGFGDAGYFPVVGGMALLDPASGEVEMVEVPGPRFAQGAIEEIAEPGANRIYVRTTVAGIKTQGAVTVEVVAPEPAVDRKALPQVEDAEEAIAAFVNGMTLDEPARSDVLALALDCWRKAS